MMPESDATPATSPPLGTTPTPSAGGRFRAAAWLLPFVLAGGLGAWWGGERLLDTFTATAAEIQSGGGGYGGPADNSPWLRAKRRVAINNAGLHYGVAGLIVGLAGGLAGGLSRRSARGSAVGGVVGGVAGGVAATGAALVLAAAFLDLYRQDQPSLLLPLMLHGGVWAAIGAATGLAVAVGRGGVPSRVASAGGGALGAALGVLAFELIYSVAYPLARGETPIPSESSARLLGHLLIPASAALGVVLAPGPRAARSAVPAAPSGPIPT